MSALQRPTTATPEPTVSIVGERVALGPLSAALIPTYQRWLNDFGMTRTISQPAPVTLEQVTGDYAQLTDAPAADFTIYERASGRPIGNVGWREIDWRNGVAEYVIFIGEADARGQGYGTEVTRLMLDYAFATLGMHNVMLRVYAYNLAGYHAYRKAGFREYGRRRQCKHMGGRLWDVIYMECLAPSAG